MLQRLRLIIRGAVQGVGFRPFIFRLAQELKLNGWVCNTTNGVLVEAEGASETLREFLVRASRDYPARAVIHSLEPIFLEPAGYRNFEIRNSQIGTVEAWISPDIATCGECRKEIQDPRDRRFRYPFTNCTHCGPRYSIIDRLPYDRLNTSMKTFTMCPLCSAEYDDPDNRRFHAQPNACPECGPRLQLWDRKGRVLAERDGALCQAVDLVRTGKILALKGIGGFHLIVDATNSDAVQMLRKRKHRVEKPFALMFPNLNMVRQICNVDHLEERILTSPESPIVLLRRRKDGSEIASCAAPGNPYLGIMLPYSPLHILFMNDLGRPLVATSGNLAEETICIDEQEALQRLGDIADFFLVHDRPIVRAVDDSIARIILETEQILRRARGYAPLPIIVNQDLPATLAVGGHLKNCVALAQGRNVFISQHIGDLETVQSYDAFHRVIDDLEALYTIKPEQVVCDLHPDYHSSEVARNMGLPVVPVQHHVAHVYACMGENDIPPPVLGISWDGSGYGTDGTVWGGEFLIINKDGFQRFASFEPFPLPGGEAAVREPRRSLLGALYAAFGEQVFAERFRKYLSSFNDSELNVLRQMLEKGSNMPLTSSVGRRFDAVAALVGLCVVNNFEGQAAMAMEFCLPSKPSSLTYSFRINDKNEAGPVLIQAPLWDEIIADIELKVDPGVISMKFHNMLSEIIVWVAQTTGQKSVVLTGGCFQNRYLTERTVARLREEGLKPFWHQRVPPNDGGIALGQILAANVDQSGIIST